MNLGIDDLNAMLQAFGRKIASERVLRGWSQADLARAASTSDHGVSRVQIGKIERGERGQLHEVMQVALALEIDLATVAEAADKARRAQ